MNSIMQIIQCILFISHPLESISLNSIDTASLPDIIINDQFYVAPKDGYIKDISRGENGFQVVISCGDHVDIVYSGLTELSVAENERIKYGDLIGKDDTISKDTKYVIIFFSSSNEFPQFKKNKLIFKIDKGNRVYMISDAQKVFVDYDPYVNGLYSKYVLSENRDFSVYYLYLQNIINTNYVSIKQGAAVAISGNSGESRFPALGLIIENDKLSDNFKVIYISVNSLESTQNAIQ